MVIGSYLTGIENKVYSNIAFFDKEDNNIACKNCNQVNSPFYFDRNIRLKKRNFDFSVTYDGKFIVSKRFKDYCIESEIEQLLFLPLVTEPDFFYFIVLGKTIMADISKSGITKKEICHVCGNREVFGGIKLFVDKIDKIDEGFYCTDIYWRTHNIFTQRFIVGLELEKQLKLQNFKGIYYKEVYC